MLLAVDGILSPFDCIEVETGTSMNDGRPASFSITNTQPARALATNSPARIPHAAPGGAALRNSRLKNLREKVALYRRLGMRTKLSKKEVFWRDSCFLAFNALAAGDHAVGGLLLQTVGFDMTAASQRRFASALTADLA
ncbi:hypothetical protein [Methylocella sp.]|uniref:hypothetical protein n=1 Tax=Methylocella sp. TaxID=1978226 RepID=UPI003C29F023